MRFTEQGEVHPYKSRNRKIKPLIRSGVRGVLDTLPGVLWKEVNMHTQDDWTVVEDKKLDGWLVRSMDKQICIVFDGGEDSSIKPLSDEAEANTTLIATAPKLLETLQKLISVYEAMNKQVKFHNVELSKAVCKGHEAIIKATGK